MSKSYRISFLETKNDKQGEKTAPSMGLSLTPGGAVATLYDKQDGRQRERLFGVISAESEDMAFIMGSDEYQEVDGWSLGGIIVSEA